MTFFKSSPGLVDGSTALHKCIALFSASVLLIFLLFCTWGRSQIGSSEGGGFKFLEILLFFIDNEAKGLNPDLCICSMSLVGHPV